MPQTNRRRIKLLAVLCALGLAACGKDFPEPSVSIFINYENTDSPAKARIYVNHWDRQLNVSQTGYPNPVGETFYISETAIPVSAGTLELPVADLLPNIELSGRLSDGTTARNVSLKLMRDFSTLESFSVTATRNPQKDDSGLKAYDVALSIAGLVEDLNEVMAVLGADYTATGTFSVTYAEGIAGISAQVTRDELNAGNFVFRDSNDLSTGQSFSMCVSALNDEPSNKGLIEQYMICSKEFPVTVN